MKYLLVSLLFYASWAVALLSDAHQPLYIEADNANFNRTSHVSIYEGNVILIQGTSRVYADKVIAFGDKNNQLQEFTATGHPARYQTQPEKDKPLLEATADTIKYHLKKHYIELIGNAHAKQAQDSIEGPLLIFKMDDQTLTAPNAHQGRTIITLQPKSTLLHDSIKN